MANDKLKKRFRKLAVESLETRRVMATLPFGAEADDTAEFMLGRVAVTPVFLESDGSIDPSTENWTPAQISSVLNNVQSGLNWWTSLLATKSSHHTLEWVIDTTFATTPKSTPYEPISRNSNAYTLWVSKFLSDVGYSSTVNLESNIRAFNNSQREKLGTDWSFTLFVVNSVNDGDGAFAPGGSFSRAFAFAGGLFEVVPSTRPASTFAHETGHMFWARDEYTGGGNYSQRRGYYNSQNTNSIDLNPDPNFQQQPSIMSAGSSLQTAYDTLTTSDATLAQIGWQDSDGDGIFDVLDVPLKLEGTGRLSQQSNLYHFVGRATVQTLPNRNSMGTQNDITLNRIGRIEYRIANGSWTVLSTPNQYVTNIDVNIPIFSAQGRIEIRAVDPRTGTASNVFSGDLGNLPDTTTQPGLQGFVWTDTDRNTSWGATETGLAFASITVLANNGQALSFQTIIEPDNYQTGLFTNPVQGIRLDVIGDDATGSLGIFDDPNASTGRRIFRPYALSTNSFVETFRDNSQQLRVRFDTPTTYVSIDAIAVADNTDVRLDAYTADGSIVQRFERKGMLNGQKATLEVGANSPSISYVIAHGFHGSYVKLDNLRIGPKSTTTTASDGSYFLPYLPVGTYQLLVQPNAPGYGYSSPANGMQPVVVTGGAIVSHVDFGVYREPSPWQNPRLNEDVNDSGAAEPLDVLILVNEINRNQSRPLDNSGLTAPPYYDVNGDRILSPLDILQLINYINRRAGSGNGEGETLRHATTIQTSQQAAPFPSFVLDAAANQPTTWIVNSTKSRVLQPSGPEKCGCPACVSIAPAGEYSPSILDIATALKPTRELIPSPVSDPREMQSVERLLNVDEYLASWDVLATLK